ncbi:hypothetical protein HDK64DRAFT_79582 [Phyllosticta capitalensis]
MWPLARHRAFILMPGLAGGDGKWLCKPTELESQGVVLVLCRGARKNCDVGSRTASNDVGAGSAPSTCVAHIGAAMQSRSGEVQSAEDR